VYPALAVQRALAARLAGVDTLWVGGEGGMEAQLVNRSGIAYRSIPAAGLHGVGLAALPRNLLQLGRGVLAARRILREYRPDVLFFTGGYVAGPMAVAGRRVPTLLYVPDIEPGLALKALSAYADRIALTAEDSQAYFGRGRRTVVTGYPLRPDLTEWTRERAARHLELSTDQPTLLVMGGSLGARSINTPILRSLDALLDMAQVIHLSGEPDWPAVEAAASALTVDRRRRYRPMPYLHEIGAAFAAADLAVSRAGASTLGELPFFGLPALLAPYPHAWRYQKVNAEYLARRGAALVIPDEQLAERLLPSIRELLHQPEQRQAMRRALHSLRRPGAADAIAGQLLELAGGSTQ
jgi:UDP-N-acetylglucosamine--N-acetylmuramyl-(pentapeptide) pyrophosphoryl-undecaprenol N-acetylglucosamine transferase